MVQSTLQYLAGLGRYGDAYVPPFAPAAVLAFLAAGFALAVSGIGAAVALAAGRLGLARLLAAAALAVASVYGTALVAASLLSPERTLAAGEKKYFCEVDCHLAYSVVRTARADGRLAVTVRTWFDPTTIAPFRGDAPLTPNPREVWLELPDGRRVAPAEDATAAWRARTGERATLEDPLRPGDSYETTFVFDAPEGGPARLFVGDPPGVERLLVGHENSPLHRRTLFALPAGAAAAPPGAASAIARTRVAGASPSFDHRSRS
jgi:predicted small lipoprotein YifL